VTARCISGKAKKDEQRTIEFTDDLRFQFTDPHPDLGARHGCDPVHHQATWLA